MNAFHKGPMTIVTERRTRDPQFSAWEKGGLKSLKSTSTVTEESAAWNFACKMFFGHTRYEFMDSIALKRVGENLYQAELKPEIANRKD